MRMYAATYITFFTRLVAFNMFNYRQNDKIDFREFYHMWTLLTKGTWELRLAKRGSSPPTDEEILSETSDMFTEASQGKSWIEKDRFIVRSRFAFALSIYLFLIAGMGDRICSFPGRMHSSN